MQRLGELTGILVARTARKMRCAQPVVRVRLRCHGASMWMGGLMSCSLNINRLWP